MITAIRIRFNGKILPGVKGVEAVVNTDLEWECEHSFALIELGLLAGPQAVSEVGYSPCDVHTAALLACRHLGAEIVQIYDDGYEPEYPPEARF